MGWGQKSSFSNPNGNSVELRAGEGEVRELRESDQPGVVVETNREKLRAFFDGVKAGEFDHLVA
jgi:hypothetical protein